jgi:DNA-binding FadR family transcriptional regulator
MELVSQRGIDIMEFIIKQHSSVPVIKQIQEQVKLAVWMGIVRSGDSLPSIREVERTRKGSRRVDRCRISGFDK